MATDEYGVNLTVSSVGSGSALSDCYSQTPGAPAADALLEITNVDVGCKIEDVVGSEGDQVGGLFSAA